VMPGDTPFQVQLPPTAAAAAQPGGEPARPANNDPWYTALWHTIADAPHLPPAAGPPLPAPGVPGPAGGPPPPPPPPARRCPRRACPAPQAPPRRPRRSPPVVDRADLEAVGRQLGREPRGVLEIAYRCPKGEPGVGKTAPKLADGTPVP